MIFLTIVFSVLTIVAAVFGGLAVYSVLSDSIFVKRKGAVEFCSKRYYTDEDKAEQISCENCAGTLFYVGRDCCLTAVICASCKIEQVIHEG